MTSFFVDVSRQIGPLGWSCCVRLRAMWPGATMHGTTSLASIAGDVTGPAKHYARCVD